MLGNTPACVTLIEPSHVESIIKLISSKNIPDYLETGIIEAILLSATALSLGKKWLKGVNSDFDFVDYE